MSEDETPRLGGVIEVLVADDHAMIRAGLRAVFEGYRDLRVCAEAHDAHTLMDAVQTRTFDVLLLDLSMPGSHGVATIVDIKKVKPDLPIVVLSMHEKPVVVRAAIDAGAMGYVTKGSDASLIVSAVRRAVAGQVTLGCSQEAFDPPALHSAMPPQEAARKLGLLSTRERQIMDHLLMGRPNREIAAITFLSEKTVSTHKVNLMRKLGVDNLVDLARLAERLALDEG